MSETHGMDWHLQRAQEKHSREFQGLLRLVNLALTLARETKRMATAEQRLISALYLPTVTESILSVALVLVDLSPELPETPET